MKISKITKAEEKILLNEYNKAQELLGKAKNSLASLLPWDSYLLSMGSLKAQNPSHFESIIQSPYRKSLN